MLFEEGTAPVVIPAGRTFLRILKGPGGAQIENLNEGDKIAIFDASRPYESQHDEAYIGTIDRSTYTDYTVVTLKQSDLSTDYTTKYSYTTSPMDAATHYPDFSQGSSAGVGVVYSTTAIEGKTVTDTSSNQINGEGSAFYEADMRDIEKTYNDAYVEFYGLRSGMNAVPYIDPQMPFYTVNETPGDDETNRLNFHQIWWKNNTYNWNYFHLVGCRGDDFVWTGSTTGITDPSNNDSYIYRWTVEGLGENQSYTPEQVNLATQALTNHELAHQFWPNRCSNLTCGSDTNLGKHDDRPWWNFTTTGCPNDNPCLMDWKGGNLIDEFNRFCKEDLFLGDPNCGSTIKPDSAIRTISDPIP